MEEKKPFPWLKIGIIGAILVIAIIVFFLIKGCSGNYIITFDTMGGSSISNQTIKKGAHAMKPIDPVKSGYKFLGWYLDDKKYDFEVNVVEDLILTAKWKSTSSSSEEVPVPTKYTVAFNSNGGTSVSSQSITKGGKVSEPSKPTKSNYEFLGWYYNGKLYDFNSIVEKSMTLVAQWSAAPTYTVTFDTTGGSEIPNKTIKEGNKVIKPVDPTKNNYTFIGWYLNDKEYNFDLEVTSNITLKAKWKENEKYTVTFVTNGGSSVDTQTVYKNGKVKKSQAPTRNNYTFDGWYYNGQEYNFNNLVTSNLTLEAKWKGNYNFSFEPDESNAYVEIIRDNLPDGYSIKYMQGNVSSSEVISNGTTLLYVNGFKVSSGIVLGKFSGLYTVVATLGGEEITTKKIYVLYGTGTEDSGKLLTTPFEYELSLTNFSKIVKVYTRATYANVQLNEDKIIIRITKPYVHTVNDTKRFSYMIIAELD